MRPRSAVLLAGGILGLAVLQVVALPGLPTGAAAPDVVVAVVLAVAYARGPLVGGLVGAWAGLVLDLVPPAAGPVGAWMLVLTLVGAAMGRAASAGRPGPMGAMALLGVGAGVAVLGRAAMLWFVGVPAAGPVAAAAATAAAWGLLLSPAVLLAVARSTGDRPAARVSAP